MSDIYKVEREAIKEVSHTTMEYWSCGCAECQTRHTSFTAAQRCPRRRRMQHRQNSDPAIIWRTRACLLAYHLCEANPDLKRTGKLAALLNVSKYMAAHMYAKGRRAARQL